MGRDRDCQLVSEEQYQKVARAKLMDVQPKHGPRGKTSFGQCLVTTIRPHSTSVKPKE